MDLTPDSTLVVRISGDRAAVERSSERVAQLARQHTAAATVQHHGEDDSWWRGLLDASWLEPGDRLVRVALPPPRLLEVEKSLAETSVARRYSVAGNLVWIRWPAARPLAQLDELLRFHSVGGTVLIGQASRYRLGVRGSESVSRRIKAALDPAGKFVGSV